MKTERLLAKKLKKKNWYQKDGSKGYVMVPTTPGSKLKKLIDKKLKSLDLPEKVKIVEKPGMKFSQILKNKSRKEKRGSCEDPKCLVGKTEKGGDCRRNEILYRITCKECKDYYLGETSRNGHTRGIEHIEDAQSQNEERREKSVLLRHMKEKHEEKEVEFEMHVIKSYQHDPLSRQCAEAIWIKNANQEKIINNKKEYHQPGDVDIRYEKNENEDLKRKRLNKKRNMEEYRSKEYQEETEVNKSDKIKENEPTIMDFIKRMRVENEKKRNEENLEEELESVSTQEMIADAKERRETGLKEFKCEQCDYKSGSTTLLRRHKESVHKTNCDKGEKQLKKQGSPTQHTESVQRTVYQCEECDYKSQSTTALKSHMSSAHRKGGYVPKRKKCELCEKKFNKNETFKKHMKEVHNTEENLTQENPSKANEYNSIEMAFQRQLRSKKMDSSAQTQHSQLKRTL